ncbi:permease prefix domain 1-containing protein [Anaeromicropila herbilytica]|uniref:Uncharacterized protein n=1 Tax=Anaeromicropila herbilytica TaxID=2785025 RepID=A0A7R7IBY9_9FIRM|nr:permease prefix domain 1-containing protein [Anaeromicropila herbilytica]BCN30153.1 hypothetical protein bsdtb5_14480 [Anaeromicropila herbilytica]
METIKNYLDNMFLNLPKNQEMLRLKEDILVNMEEKYSELKKSGKSENEAIGIVISEFGNIDELLNEYQITNQDMNTVDTKAADVTLTQTEVAQYLEDKKKNARSVAFGVILCILGAAVLILITQLGTDMIFGNTLTDDIAGTIGVITLLIFVVAAVAIFIASGARMERYKYLKDDFYLPSALQSVIEEEYQNFSYRFTKIIILGVSICILSPTVIFVGTMFGDSGSVYSVVLLLCIIATAVYLFCYFGGIREGYKVLLKLEEYKREKYKKKSDRVIGAVSAIVWPIAVCIFLVSGLVYEQWDINWIVFPITGILFGMFCSAYHILTDNRKTY